MFTMLSDIKISLGKALLINGFILGIAFYSGVFWTNSNRHETELDQAIIDYNTQIDALDQRLDKKIDRQNAIEKQVNNHEVRITVNEVKIKD